MSTPLRPLRHVALTVQQSGQAAYAWLLIESAGGRVFVLKKPGRTWSSYLGALDAGYQELALLSACGLHQAEGGEAAANDPVAIDNRETSNAI